MHFEDMREVEPQAPAPEPQTIKGGFSWGGFVGGLAALMWLVGAVGAPFSLLGLDGLATLNPALQAGLVALAFGPSVLIWISASALAEAVKARRVAQALAQVRQAPPAAAAPLAVSFDEERAQRLSSAVRQEVASLNDAVSTALARLDDLETAAQRNAAAFAQALAETRESALDFMGDLSRERDAFLRLNQDMKNETDAMAHQVSRQVRLMREASKLVKTEMTAAEDALETHLAAFGNSAHVMAERTEALKATAENASGSSQHLSKAMGAALDGLAETTKLTDAARRAAENATAAAAETASAAHETTQRAVVEAQRAAQFIRAESEAMLQGARATMLTLKDAAEAARTATEQSQAVADRHAASIEKRLGALASTAAAKKAERVEERIAQRAVPVERVRIERVANESYPERSLHAAAAEVIERGEPRRVAAGGGGRSFPAFTAFTDWKPAKASTPASRFAPANTTPANDEMDAFSLADFGDSDHDPDAALKRAALELIEDCGVSLDRVLSERALDQIASRSRMGALSRRSAVAETAPDAVARIARFAKRNAGARSTASQFRARPDLTRHEDKNSDLTRAYLLIDAALD
jgi:hypothetical protein